MQDREHPTETVPRTIQDMIHGLLSALRAIKLYPPNNPVYSQTIAKAYALTGAALHDAPTLRLRVQKAGLLYHQIPLDREGRFSRGIAADLFSRGIREVVVSRGVSEDEFHRFLTCITLPPEELDQRGGIESLLWNEGITHIRVTGAALEIHVQEGFGGHDADAGPAEEHPDRLHLADALRGRTVVVGGEPAPLTDLVADPAAFGRQALERSSRTTGNAAGTQEERLWEIYGEVGRQILSTARDHSDALLHALAESVLSLGPDIREGLIARRLIPAVDRRMLQTQVQAESSPLLHEIVSARFTHSWTVPQVAGLLRTVSIGAEAPSAPSRPETPLPVDLALVVQELSGYTPEEMESLKRLSEDSTEQEGAQAAVITLIHLLSAALHPAAPELLERTLNRVANILSILEDLVTLLLDRKDYPTAVVVLRTLLTPVEPPFRARMAEAVKRAGGRKRITALLHDLRTVPKDSAMHQAIIGYLSLLDREVTPVMLEMMAEEEDLTARKILVQLLKGMGKNQIALLGARLSDERWYFVRNIIGILGESRKEEAVDYLERVAGHRNFQIRQEVVRALINIGGKRAADLLIRFLNDRDVDIRFMAVRGIGLLPASGAAQERALMDFLRSGWFRRIDPHLRLEAVASLARCGGPEAVRFLTRYARIRWWKAQKPQEEQRFAALGAIAEIERRTASA